MKRAGVVAGLLTAGALSPTISAAADPALVKDVAPLIVRGCDPLKRTIAAGDLRRAMMASDALRPPLNAPRSRPGSSLGEDLAAAQFPRTPGAPHGLTRDSLGFLIEEWIGDGVLDSEKLLLPYGQGGVRVVRPAGVPVVKTEKAPVLAAILDGRDDTYKFVCEPSARGGTEPPITAPPPAAPGQGVSRLSVAKAAESLAIGDLSQKAPAEVALLSDLEADADSYAVNAAVGLVFDDVPLFRNSAGRPQGYGQGALFAQYDRQGGDATADQDEVNNLSFGGMFGGFIAPDRGGAYFYAVSARVMTDDRFQSRAYGAAAEVTPVLFGNRIFPVRDAFDLRWRFTLRGDLLAVDDPGRKALLQSSPEFVRLGYDARLSLTSKSLGFWPVTLGLEHRYREGLTDDGGDADRFEADLALNPNPNVGFGVEYERGENVDSLEFSDQVKFTVRLRR